MTAQIPAPYAAPTPTPGLIPLQLAADLVDPDAAERSFPAALAEQVRAHGHLVAVQDSSGCLTYAELTEQAGRVAAALAPVAGPRDRPVLVLARHGVPVVIALVGVAMAGHPYVVLDPTAPDDARRRICLRFAGSAIVADGRHAEAAGQLPGLGPMLPLADLPAGEPPMVHIAPADPIFVSWTSGSTGEPKGVVHSHRSVLRNALRVAQAFDVQPGDRLLVAAPFAYVGSATPVFTALAAGAAVCPYGLVGEGVEGLPAFMAAAGITIAQLSPAHVRAVAEQVVRAGGHASMRLVLIGGDRLEPFHVARLAEAFPRARVVHRYSTSETNWIAGAEIDVERCPDVSPLPLGWPVPWLDVDVLDDDGGSVVSGAVGELVVDGDALALGYWADAAQTAARFAPGARGRRYASGDDVRRGADGLLAFVGRADRTLKVNGVLVDLVAVELALRSVAGVVQAAAVAWQAGSTRIAAFVVMDRPGEELTGAAVRREVGRTLPPAMVPATVDLVLELPVTVRGKVDLPALARLAGSRGPAEHAEPVGPGEQAVARQFEAVLGVARVGRDDDFYALGADSLDTMALVVGLEPVLGRDLEASTILAHPTPALLAALAEGPAPDAPDEIGPAVFGPDAIGPDVIGRDDEGRVALLLAATSGPADRLPLVLCSGGGGGEVELMSALARAIGDRTVFVTVPRGFERRGAPDRSIAAMAATVVREVVAVAGHMPVALAGHSSGGVVAFEAARQLAAAGVPVPVVVLIDTRAPDPAGRRIRRRIAARVVAVQTGGLPQPAKSLAYVRAVVRPRRWWWGMTAGHVARTGPAQWNCFTVLREYALDRYRPGRYGGDVVLLRAADQADGHKATGDLSGWLRLLGGPARIVEIEGRHSTVVRPPYLQGTAEHVRAALQSHDAERPPDPPEPTDRMSAS